MSYDPLTTLAATKVWLAKNQQQTGSDPQLEILIAALSAEIGRYCGRDNLGNVLTYTERYELSSGGKRHRRILLRHYPVVALTQVQVGSSIIPITTDLTGMTCGVLLEPPRTLRFFGYEPVYPLVITYTAGHYPMGTAPGSQPSTIPPDLALVCQQWIMEVLQSRQQANQKSQSLAGQTISYDQGEAYGMSPRTARMLQPFINRVPQY